MSPRHLKTIVYAKFGGQTKCIIGNSKIENDVTDAMLEPLNKETAAMLESRPNPPGI